LPPGPEVGLDLWDLAAAVESASDKEDHPAMSWREWTGVGVRRWKTAPDEHVEPGKTLWDWLQLLIEPVILIAVTLAWSAAQTRSDNKREDRRIAADRLAAEQARLDATLNSYLAQMGDLMLNRKLSTSENTSASGRLPA